MTQLKNYDDRQIAYYMEIISKTIGGITAAGLLVLGVISLPGLLYLAFVLSPLWLTAGLVIYGYGRIRRSEISNTGMMGWWAYCALQNLAKVWCVYSFTEGVMAWPVVLIFVWCLFMAALSIWGLCRRVMAIWMFRKMKIHV